MASGFDVTIKIAGREDVSRASVKAERSLTRLGTRGSRALKKIGSVGARVKRSMQALGRAIFSLRGAVAALLGALAARAVVSSVIAAANEQIDAETKLAQALSTVAGNASGALERLKEYAGQLQKLTGIGDETIISMMALLGTFQASEKSIKTLTPAILDFAASQGLDLTAAALLVGKAIAGQIATLSRYGITLTDTQRELLTTGTEMEKVATIAGLLTKRFGGTAEALGATFAGRLKLLRGNFGDLQEEIGFQFIPTLKPLIALAAEYVEQIKNWIKTHNVAAPALRQTVDILAVLVQVIGIAGKSVIGFQLTWLGMTGIVQRSMARLIAPIEAATRLLAALGLVSRETFRQIAIARTNLELFLPETVDRRIEELSDQFVNWDLRIQAILETIAEFRALIVPQFERVGEAGKKALDSIKSGADEAAGALENLVDKVRAAFGEEIISLAGLQAEATAKVQNNIELLNKALDAGVISQSKHAQKLQELQRTMVAIKTATSAAEISQILAAQAAAKQTAEVIRLKPALDDAGKAAGGFADKQKALGGAVDLTTDALIRNAAAARQSAAAAAAFGRGSIADLLGLLQLAPSDPRRQAAGGGFRILSRLRDLGFSGGVSLAQHGAVLTGPTALIGGEAGRELVVPARRDQRSPEVQAEFERLMAAEGGGVMEFHSHIYLDGRKVAHVVRRHNRRAA